jgi:hypothetical protein
MKTTETQQELETIKKKKQYLKHHKRPKLSWTEQEYLNLKIENKIEAREKEEFEAKPTKDL